MLHSAVLWYCVTGPVCAGSASPSLLPTVSPSWCVPV